MIWSRNPIQLGVKAEICPVGKKITDPPFDFGQNIKVLFSGHPSTRSNATFKGKEHITVCDNFLEHPKICWICEWIDCNTYECIVNSFNKININE